MNQLNSSVSMTAMQVALVAAGVVTQEAVQKHLDEPMPRTVWQPRRKYGRSKRVQALLWAHDSFGEIDIGSEWKIERDDHVGPNHWARLAQPEGRPRSVSFRFTGIVAEGVRVLHVAADGTVTDMSKWEQYAFPVFKVEIEYKQIEVGPKNNQTKVLVPSTRFGDNDDMELVFIRPDGAFVQLEVSLTFRAGKPWLGVQEIYCGQGVVCDLSTAEALKEAGFDYHEVDGRAVSVVPLYEENAYPSQEDPEKFHSYLGMFQNDIGKKVAEYLYRWKAVVPVEQSMPAPWQPELPTLTDNQIKSGWKKGVTAFFNLTCGIGSVVCEDMKHCFVHFKQIIDKDGQTVLSKGQLPMLLPMSKVIFKYEEKQGTDKKTGQPTTYRKAISVRAV